MTQQTRFLLFVAISVTLLYGWSALFAPPPPPPGKKPVATETADAGQAAPTVPSPPPAELAPAQPEQTPEPELKTVTVENGELWRATFTTQGAALSSFELLGTKQSTRPEKGERRPFDLVHRDEQQPMALATELTLPGGALPVDARWEVEQTADAVTFTRRQGGHTVTKRYTWKPGTYQLALEVTVAGPGLGDEVPVKVHYAVWEKPEGSTGFMGMGGSRELHQAVCLTSEGIEREGWDDNKVLPVSGAVKFAGIDEKYFIAAVAPTGDQQATCAIGGSRPGALEFTVAGAARGQGEQRVATFDLFLGPKDVDLLTAADHGLLESIDFGFFAIIARPLLALMKVFESVVGNWGVAIILLTLLVKLATFPLTHKQMKSMEEMKRLAPKLEELKKKYAGDQQRVNLETMKLYKDHNVQPLAGCLPMLIQMPVWFALYTMLSNSFELYNEPFVAGWIADLTSKDPYYVLPILMTVTMVATQILTPQPQQNQQMKMMMYGMPIFFGFIMLTLPAGLVLYIFTNNVLSIGQSLWFRKVHGASEVKPA